MKLLGTTERNRDKHSENVPHLENTEVILAHCTVLNNSYQQEFCINLLQINYSVIY